MPLSLPKLSGHHNLSEIPSLPAGLVQQKAEMHVDVELRDMV